MAIDIRADVTCSLGPVISGNIGDDYLQGSGLIKTQGSVLISGLITPDVGTIVTFEYTKSGTTRRIPRAVRVLSSFADPFRRTTQVELGCKLTYLSDLNDPLTWDAFDDGENGDYNESDTEIIVVPIWANSVMAKCLTELNIQSSSNPLTNKFSIAEFDFSSGYVQILSDLLVSESYFGYLDTNEILQIVHLDQSGGSGPAFSSGDIIDLSSIGTGSLPGEAVIVSYSSLRLKYNQNENEEDNPVEEDPYGAGWDFQEQVNPPVIVYLTATMADGGEWSSSFSYIPVSTTRTYYDSWSRVTKKVTEENTIGAVLLSTLATALAGADPPRTGAAVAVGRAEYKKFTTTTYEYKVGQVTSKEKPKDYDLLVEETTTVRESPDALLGVANLNYENEEGEIGNIFLNTDPGGYIDTSIVKIVYKTGKASAGADISRQTTTKTQSYVFTQSGQQYIASRTKQGAFWASLLGVIRMLVFDGTTISTTIGRAPSGTIKPASADQIKDKLSDGDWTTENTTKLELVFGSVTAQQRIELSMPYAPDDSFYKTFLRFDSETGEPVYGYFSSRSDAASKANLYGIVQNRLLLGNRSGVNLQVAPDRMPTAPFSPLFLEANGLTALYRANGNQWAFDANGIVCSTDALFWGGVGGTGNFWFPVAPGVVSLPESPTVVNTAPTQVIGTIETVGSNPQSTLDTAFPDAIPGDGVQDQATNDFWVYGGTTWSNVGATPGPTIESTTVVLPYNITFIYESRLRVGNVVTKFDYALTLLTVIPRLTVRTNLRLGVVTLTPSVSVALSALSSVETGSLSIPIDIADIATAGLAPVNAGEPNTIYVDNTGEIALAGQTPTPPSVEALDLVFNFDGADSSTSIISSSGDIGPITATVTGTAALDTSNEKFGTASLYFDTSPGLVQFAIPQAFGLDDFCVEFWTYVPDTLQDSDNYTTPYSYGAGSSLDADFINNQYLLYFPSLPLEQDYPIANIVYNQYQHIAVYRLGGIFYLAVDGVVSTDTITTAYNFTNAAQVIGDYDDFDGNSGFFATQTTWIDELRVTFNSAVYGATNFTAPSSPF